VKEFIMANVNGGAQPKVQTDSRDTAEVEGRTTIEDSVVAKIAGIAAREVSGVHALGGGAARVVGSIRDALNSTDLTQGISVEVGEKQVAVDVTIVAEYPVALQTVSDDVRTAVYRAMRDLVGMDVAEVNVTVNDVHLPTDDDQENEPQTGRVQ
jgi:uncharacterized alkaline shock family protein YloU